MPAVEGPLEQRRTSGGNRADNLLGAATCPDRQNRLGTRAVSLSLVAVASVARRVPVGQNRSRIGGYGWTFQAETDLARFLRFAAASRRYPLPPLVLRCSSGPSTAGSRSVLRAPFATRQMLTHWQVLSVSCAILCFSPTFKRHNWEKRLFTQPGDRELLTRHEMQNSSPDLLVTNYSMLEYMLLRPIERSIFRETRRWLESDSRNQLLLVLDEAHMYRGVAGAEVGLLIRRLQSRLGIAREQMRCILTSASLGSGTAAEEAGKVFAEGLTDSLGLCCRRCPDLREQLPSHQAIEDAKGYNSSTGALNVTNWLLGIPLSVCSSGASVLRLHIVLHLEVLPDALQNQRQPCRDQSEHRRNQIV